MSQLPISQVPTSGSLSGRRQIGASKRLEPREALMFCAIGSGLTVNFVFVAWAAHLYPGAHYPSAIASIFLVLPVAALYWFFSTAMPRSGGEYAYIGRVIHPAVGLLASFTVTATIAGAIGLVSDWLVTYGLADSFAAVSLSTGGEWADPFAAFLAAAPGRTVVGTLAIGASLLIWLKGAKWVLWVSWIAVGLTLVMLPAAAVVVFIAGGHSGFVSQWNTLSEIPYAEVLDYASRQGYVLGFAPLATLMAGVTYVLLNTTGTTFSSNIAGEVKSLPRSQVMALFGSLIFLMVFLLLGVQLLYSAVGGDFNQALNQIIHRAPEAYPAVLGGREPIITLMLGFFTSNPVFLMAFGFFMAWNLFASAADLGFAMIRNISAWSFDCLIPRRFAESDNRYGSPRLPTLTFALACEGFLMVAIWLPDYMSFAGFQVVAWFLAWLLLGCSGILFPFRRRRLFEKAPALVRTRFLGLPVISILGLLTLIISLAAEATVAMAFINGLIDWHGLLTVAAMLAVSGVVYWLSKLRNARDSIPLGMHLLDER